MLVFAIQRVTPGASQHKTTLAAASHFPTQGCEHAQPLRRIQLRLGGIRRSNRSSVNATKSTYCGIEFGLDFHRSVSGKNNTHPSFGSKPMIRI
jgi:hypothetical protein